MIAYSEALQHLLDAATPLPAERLPLHEAADIATAAGTNLPCGPSTFSELGG